MEMVHYKTYILMRCTFKEIDILVGLDRLSAIARGRGFAVVSGCKSNQDFDISKLFTKNIISKFA